MVPFSFATPVYPEVTPGAYFLQSKNAASMDKYVVVDPCKVVEMTNPNGLDLVSNEPTADRSYNVWMVSVDESRIEEQRQNGELRDKYSKYKMLLVINIFRTME